MPAVLNGIMTYIVVPILEGFFVFTFLIFVWGVVQMIIHADDPDGRKTGQNHVLWGVIGMTIMISAYGIIRLIAATLAPVGVESPFI